MSTDAKRYKETLNLPTTAFAMKANLAQREPQVQQRWKDEGLYAKIRASRSGRPRRVLHDGPPYANGEIHMGHLLNKVLKDVVVRYLTMKGFDSPYVPGWDCHGLPIEHKVVKELGGKVAGMGHAEIRARCQDDAMKWVGIQRDQFIRLGVSGDWENPYLTLDPRYEAGILDVLAALVDSGSVYRQLKPIHWCMTDRTALAEAELEYKDETSPSIYVNFPMETGVPASWGQADWHAMIWTTTPWTLPANVAIALHPNLDYAGVRYTEPDTGREVHTILAAELVGKVLGLREITEFTEVGRVKGRELEHARFRHPFADRTGPLVLAEYVSVDDGTGLVHTAPGHGTEDYQTGQRYGLPTLSPVDATGKFTAEAPEGLVGRHVFKANPVVLQMLRTEGVLFHEVPLTHSYPHCWRCKNPVIFRATDQWFVDVDHGGLRERTMEAIDKVRWVPGWGRARIEGMVQNRPDWCISRQRSWGVPIPAFACNTCDSMLLTGASIRHVRDIFRERGADAWFTEPAEALVPPEATCPGCGGTDFRKENDILDVWFESGSSHRAVLVEPSYGLNFPAYMYLEGSDQHRGWFQSSILTSVGASGAAPFETVLTHGFIVDEKGQKMAKSGGNAVSAVKATDQYGADVLRLYVTGMDYSEDVRMSERGIKEMSEAYRKIRNTFRYLLGNLNDYQEFDPATVEPETLHEIDRWALGQLNRVIADVTAAYERFEFYRAVQRIYQFCSVDLSSFYLDVLKDRLYAEHPTGPDRRAAQFVLARLHDVLTRLIAPITPHTAEELWDVLPAAPDKPESVHLAMLPVPDPQWDDAERDERWETLLEVREKVLLALEGMRKEKRIGSAQEARVQITTTPARASCIDSALMTTIGNLSEAKVMVDANLAADAVGVTAEPSPHPKCERCWNLRPTVGQDAEHPTLCERCVRVVKSLPAAT